MPKTKRRRPNVFRIDPTRTVTIRKRFVAEMRRRFAKIRGEIVRLIAIDDAFGILRRITTNKAGDDWRFATSSEQVKAFQEWLEELYGEHLSIQQLMKKFAEDGYKRGIGRAFNDVEKPYGNGKMIYDNLTGDFYTPNRDQFLRSAFGSHIGIERVNQLASRSFGDLKNVTTDMSTRMSRTLLEGLVDGSHPNDIAKDLSKDIDISLSRAETIARTEIIRAHAEGQLDAMERMGISEVGVQVEWVTAGDDAVCPRCEAMEGVVMEIEKAHNMLPMHPNCRCAFLPAGEVLQPRTIAEAAAEGLALTDVENIFCPTGEGGGVDPSCGGEGGSGSVKVAELTPEEAALPPTMRAVVSASRILSALRSVGEAVGSRTTPPEISVTPKATEHIKTMFGGTGSVDSIAKMVGATEGASVVISEPIVHSTGQKFIRAEIDHPDYGAVRWVFDDHIENITFTAKETGKGLGTKVFAQQVAEAAAKGLKYIGTNAIRTKHANGYYTWARLGYDGKVPMGQHGGKKVSELMKTKEGRDWWKEHGQSIAMTFDLTEGSQSRRVLDAYLQERSKRAGAGGTTANYDSGGRGYFGLDLGLDGRVMTLEDVENVFCPTGEGGGVDPSCGGGGGGGSIETVSSEVKSALVKHGLSENQMVKLTGAQSDYNATIDFAYGDIGVIVKSPDYEAWRSFDLSTKTISNEGIRVKDTGKGLGTQIFTDQVAVAVELGFKSIKTRAARSPTENGYYTWARLGYDGDISRSKWSALKAAGFELSTEPKVSELMRTAAGRDWWKANGHSFDGVFDLAEGSQSRRVLDAYVREKQRKQVSNVFCPTGEGGGVDPTCSPPSGGGLPASKMPAEPSFVSSNVTAVKANKAAIQSMKDLASSGALETLKAHEGTPSPKVQQFKKDLIAALEQHKADEEDRIPWATLVVEDDPIELPANLTGAKILKENMGGGSQTPPKLIEKDGKKLVMKVSKNAATLDHIKSEVDADNAYRAAGFAVPVSSMSTYNGNDVKIAEFLEGAKELNEWENNASYEEIAAVYADIAKGMAADALFANWDAVGTGKNNIMVKENPFGPPSIFRVDNGGSFKYRAMGELKKDWNYKVTLKSLQDPSKNPNADVYTSVTDEELHGQIQSLLDNKLDIIKAVKDPETRDILEQRFNHMESQMAALAPAPSAPKSSSLFPDGDSITDLLKDKGDKAHTKLYMKKVAALNPNGIENGTIKIPISFYTPAKGSKEAAVAKLHETVKWLEGKVPAGTKVEAVEKYLTAKTLGITKTFGNDGDKFTSTQATTAAQEHATIPDKLQKYLPSPVKGVVTLTNTPDPPKDEAWKAKLSYDEKNAVSSWKGSAKSIRVAISSGRMTPTAEAFMSVLEKAPIHEGVVYRGISGKYAEDIAKHIVAAGIGGLWSDAAPHCMSTNIATAESFANGKVLLRIVTKTGRTIWKEDGFSGEKEVTGMPGTLYKIMAIDKDVKDSKAPGYAGKLNHMITLMEVGKK